MKTLIISSFQFLLLILLFDGCKPRHIPKHQIISFKPYFGIKYTEIQRRLNNGLAFNEYGYQLEPEWQLEFLANDSARIYSPTKKTYINFPLSRGYDSVFNTARTWYKMHKMTKDSLVMEILRFSGDSIDLTGNKVFMTFYANKYITDVLHTNTATLRRPTRRDTAFMRTLVAMSATDINKSFAARQPVQLISTNSLISVEKHITTPTMLNHFDVSDDYLDPEFYIFVKNAYNNFSFSFTVYVDAKGQMTFGVPLIVFFGDDQREAFIRRSKALINGYLKYLKVIPGSTLGMPHASKISLHVKGRVG